MLHNRECNEDNNECNNISNASRRIQVVITEVEYKAFREALKRSGRYHSMSDALRDFIRDFVDAQGVTPRSVVGVGGSKKKEAEADG